MRDFLPADIRKRNYVIGIIKEVYESYGFEPLETPAVENIETLLGKYGEEGNQLVFKILKRGEKLEESLGSRESAGSLESKSPEGSQTSSTSKTELADLALRYDLTVPLARVVANRKNDLPKFFKRYQIQPVWRADRPARGRFREFYQCDVDAIGSNSMVVEAEVLSAVSEILRRLGFEDFTIRLNHRQVLTDILDTAGVPDELHTDALVAIDKLDKIGPEGVLEELNDRGVSDEASTMLMEIFAKTQEILNQEKDINRTIVANLINIVSNETLAELGQILKFADKAQILIDPSLARGLSYYTGAIMEISVPDLAGSLGGGGRYDNLIGSLIRPVKYEDDAQMTEIKWNIPSCGFSLGLERILVVMEERGMFPPKIAESTAADVMITIWDEESISASLKLAADLRAQGMRVTVYPEPDKLGKQLKYADSIRVPYVCILGPDEVEKGVVRLKNLKTSEEIPLAAHDIASNIK